MYACDGRGQSAYAIAYRTYAADQSTHSAHSQRQDLRTHDAWVMHGCARSIFVVIYHPTFSTHMLAEAPIPAFVSAFAFFLLLALLSRWATRVLISLQKLAIWEPDIDIHSKNVQTVDDVIACGEYS